MYPNVVSPQGCAAPGIRYTSVPAVSPNTTHVQQQQMRGTRGGSVDYFEMEEDEGEVPSGDMSPYGLIGGDIPMTGRGLRQMDVPAIRASGQIDPSMQGTFVQYPVADPFLAQYPTI
jgi:hypothetical protein